MKNFSAEGVALMMLRKKIKYGFAAFSAAFLFCTPPVSAAPGDFFADISAEHTEKAPRPQDDFYLSVNYDWIRSLNLSEGESRDMFCPMEDKAELVLGGITTAASLEPEKNTDFSRISALYACLNDESGREKAGYGELSEVFEAIDSAETVQEYAERLGSIMGTYRFTAWFGGFDVERDWQEGKIYVPVWGVPQLRYGDELYSNNADENRIKLAEEHVAGLLMLYGRDAKRARESAEKIISMQRRLEYARNAVPIVENPFGRVRMSAAELSEIYTHIDLMPVLEAAGIGGAEDNHTVDVKEPEVLQAADEFLVQENLPVLKDYALVYILDAFEDVLTPAYEREAESFRRDFYRTSPTEKSAKMQHKAEQIIPELYGRQYALLFEDDETRQDIMMLAEEIKSAYRRKIDSSDWMSGEAKEYAKVKLDSMRVKIGAPEKWPLHIDSFTFKHPRDGGVLIDNVLALYKAKAKAAGAQLFSECDGTEESFLPQTVNAFYRPSENAVIIPEALLRKPFYDKKYDRIEKLGGIGVIMAHEMSHSFDTLGAQFDADGCRRRWWTDEDEKAYREKICRISEYYSRYVSEGGQRTNGEQTVTENIADLGGISVVTELAGEKPEDLRRLYTKAAVCWRAKAGTVALRRKSGGVHALPHVRIDAVMSATDAFYRAFDVEKGDCMYVGPEDRVGLW